MNPTLPVSQSPSLTVSPALCCHTMADWRQFLTTIGPSRIRIDNVLLFLSVCARGRVPWKDVSRAGQANVHLKWGKSHLRHSGLYLTHTDTLLPAMGLRDADTAASIERVLRMALSHRGNLKAMHLGVMVHASAPGGVSTQGLRKLPWTACSRRITDILKDVRDMGLVRREECRAGTAMQHVNHLTEKGLAMMLGHWGEALVKKDGETGRLGDSEQGRMAA